MAVTVTSAYPLQRQLNTSTGRSPMAITNEVERYRNMLQADTASVEVGLFYQLNQAASPSDGKNPVEVDYSQPDYMDGNDQMYA